MYGWMEKSVPIFPIFSDPIKLFYKLVVRLLSNSVCKLDGWSKVSLPPLFF